MQMAGEALDKVRKQLTHEGADLKGSLWAIRGNEWTRSEEQCQQGSSLCNRYPKLGRAIGLRDMLQDILRTEDEASLRWWCKRAKLSRLEPFRDLAINIKKHWSGVVAFRKTRLTNGAIEAVNGLLQLAKRLAALLVPCIRHHGHRLPGLTSRPPYAPTLRSEWPQGCSCDLG